LGARAESGATGAAFSELSVSTRAACPISVVVGFRTGSGGADSARAAIDGQAAQAERDRLVGYIKEAGVRVTDIARALGVTRQSAYLTGKRARQP
jgi:hypothetical protein